jgi:hypothetical protein
MDTADLTFDNIHRQSKLQKYVSPDLEIFKLDIVRNPQTELGYVIL